MKYIKQLLVLLALALLLVGCEGVDTAEQPPAATEATQPEAPEATQPEATQPEVTQPEATEATQPEATEPEVTEPEVTEPQATEPAGTRPSTNNGVTGGGYDPGTSEPTQPGTEPEEPTEPEIVPPPAGSRENAYYEYIADPAGKFETVKIPAGETVFYRIKTPGTFLVSADGDLTVTVQNSTRKNTNITLTGNDLVSFTNNGTQEKAFTLEVKDKEGSQTNPVVIESLKGTELAANTYYRWTCDKEGPLRLALPENVTAWLNGQELPGEIILSQEDVLDFLFTGEDGQTAVIYGYVAATAELAVTELPSQVETEAIPAGESVIYTITGAQGRQLTVTGGKLQLLFNGTVYTLEEAGSITLVLPREGDAQLELYNGSQEAAAYTLHFGYAPGHEENPLVLTQLEELPVALNKDESGFYMTYTPEEAGIATFQMWTYPEGDGITCNIAVTNETTGEHSVLIDWNEQGDKIENLTAAVQAKPGDSIWVQVTAVDLDNNPVDAAFSINGILYGTQEMPISVEHPGFSAWVPAGGTMYYQGYNLTGLPMTLQGSDVEVTYNGVTYTPENGEIKLTVTEGLGTPSRFAITNQSQKDMTYTVSLEYPLGHMENPAPLKRGTNTLTQVAGGEDYYYILEVPRDTTMKLTFNASANWVYAVDNITQGIYGDTQFSDSDPQQAETVITASAGDVIIVRVNTYDPENPYETPAGTVTFTAR